MLRYDRVQGEDHLASSKHNKTACYCLLLRVVLAITRNRCLIVKGGGERERESYVTRIVVHILVSEPV